MSNDATPQRRPSEWLVEMREALPPNWAKMSIAARLAWERAWRESRQALHDVKPAGRA